MERTNIYGLIDPRTRLIRYVGKTFYSIRSRCQGHIDDSTKGDGTNHTHNWIRQLVNAGYRPTPLLLEVVVGDGWGKAEAFWIDLLRSLGYNLTNHMEGGIGGFRHDEITKERIRQKRKKQVVRHSPATRAKMSEVAKGRPKSKEHRLALSRALMGHPSPPNKGVPMSEEQKQKLREAALKQWAEGRAKPPPPPQTGPRPQEVREKISKALKGRMTEETKAKLAEARRRYWEKRRAQCSAV